MGYLFRGADNKDCSILGSILGSPYFGKLPTLKQTRSETSGHFFVQVGSSSHAAVDAAPCTMRA